ncbi:DUF2384 domain-containing protein [Rhodoblastus sp. 17X3]|uniref:antitoxin Xre/MbcA/ParS toxin-binding domain-containing protein n=1 Tax=Rhodoblastus sp. 17X3 TaxID=3047026 RepID=UPI0024B78D14|nr:antitoxin Xre/MbcA/ParS toxin-binding domain-containing protein [Rhodoblastus sp. 17X3]MDI9847093.1 DUF2384 domain-containing protein [Rhodoblastus sp. 17X3]
MSLAFGVGNGPDMIGALSVPRSLGPRKHRGAAAAFWAGALSSSRDFMERATALRGSGRSALATGSSRRMAKRIEENEIRDAFARNAELAGLAVEERSVLLGDACELSAVILALEIFGAALELFGSPAAAVAWLRGENVSEPFNGRAPLRLMAADGRLGVEITLLYLRARLRLTRHEVGA